MIHSFDTELAEKYGLNEAIMLNNLWFWVEHNKANKTNYFDGFYWTYNSTKAFSELFPYLSQRKISNALNNLKDLGIIQTGNYNKSAYDRTLWYAFTKMGESIMQKCKMEDAIMLNGLCNNVEPIPYNKTTDIKTQMENTDIDAVIEAYKITCISFSQPRVITKERKQKIKTRLKTFSVGEFQTAFEKAEKSDFCKNNKFFSLDWIIKNDENLLKVLEGNYDNKANKPISNGIDWNNV